uniref:Uncharacterized protein n=1 Tax=Tenebrio molitor TaxID=7067 RepID=A0A8J6H534_TENMO|nr:hypothetical protein GEV33_014891 [Tenebrio molitor]
MEASTFQQTYCTRNFWVNNQHVFTLLTLLWSLGHNAEPKFHPLTNPKSLEDPELSPSDVPVPIPPRHESTFCRVGSDDSPFPLTGNTPGTDGIGTISCEAGVASAVAAGVAEKWPSRWKETIGESVRV